jgi:hypothetical protein
MTIARGKSTCRPGLLRRGVLILTVIALLLRPGTARPEGDWETTPGSELALERGLQWLAANQGPEGNWQSNDLGLVSLGALAFLSAGHTPGHGKYGAVVDKAFDYVLRSARPNGLLNVADARRDMYNHGLATFVLAQAYGMTDDKRIGAVLDRALALIANTQCDDGGWDYRAHRQPRGHDLSLAVMQAKALRGAMDSGLEVSPVVTRLAIRSVRAHYRARSGSTNFDDPAVRAEPGQFTYDGHGGSLAMAACGVVCLQEFGEYDDWRIARNMDLINASVSRLTPPKARGRVPLGAYGLYYVGQALYQVGGQSWKDCYPPLRDALTASQSIETGDPRLEGSWEDAVHLSGHPGRLYGTAVGCFVLAIPNRYLPILQEGRIDSLKTETRKH